jgi:hypothetical protein
MLLLSACRTTAGTKEKPAAAKPAAIQAEKLLQKIVGGINPKDQVYDCSITSSDVSNADEIRRLIAQVPRGTIKNVAYHFRAQEPSLEIYAFENNQPITLVKDHSTREVRDDDASKSLIEKIDAKCPTPKP